MHPQKASSSITFSESGRETPCILDAKKAARPIWMIPSGRIMIGKVSPTSPNGSMLVAFSGNLIYRLPGVIYDHDQSLDELKAEIAQLGTSNEGIVQLLHLNSVEIFQIMGLAMVKHGERNILFINSLSDFALAMELGQPIRADHSSFALNPEKQTGVWFLASKYSFC